MDLAFSVSYDHPVARVFPYLAEPETWSEWVPAVVERTRLDDAPAGPGTRWRAVDRIAGPWRIEFTEELVALEPHERVVFEHAHPWNARTEYRVEADGDRTVVHVQFRGSLRGSLRLVGLMPRSLATKVFAADLERLGELLERTR